HSHIESRTAARCAFKISSDGGTRRRSVGGFVGPRCVHAFRTGGSAKQGGHQRRRWRRALRRLFDISGNTLARGDNRTAAAASQASDCVGSRPDESSRNKSVALV